MKIPNFLLIKIFISILVLTGCSTATYKYASAPVSKQIGTNVFQAIFTPEKNQTEYFTWFKLDLKNLSQEPIEIDWNKTAYLLNGKNRGPFVWKGIEPERIKDKTLPKTMIEPGDTFSKEISPLAKVAMAHRSDYAAGKDKPGIYSGILPAGENGILLALWVKGELILKKLVVVITEEKQ